MDATNVLCIWEIFNRCNGGKQKESAEFTHARYTSVAWLRASEAALSPCHWLSTTGDIKDQATFK